MLLGKGVPTNEGAKEGHPLKRRYFTVIGLSSVEMVAVFRNVNFDDLEPPK